MSSSPRVRNWAGNVTYRAHRLHRPRSVAELQDVVASADRIKALGTGHSFSRVADTTGDHVVLDGLSDRLELEPSDGCVTVSAGTTYGELAARLHGHRRALANLGSLPHISIAGACATGTHGSGDRNRSLASAVTALDLVIADGTLVSLRRDAGELDGAVVALGGLGVVTALTLETVPAFDVSQVVYDGLPLDRLADRFDEIFAAAYSVSVFTDWQSGLAQQVWLKRRTDGSAAEDADRVWLGAELAASGRHPVPGMSPLHCTEQLGVAGPAHDRLPHFRAAFTPSSGEELQSELLLPRVAAVPAVEALRSLGGLVGPVLQVAEIRTVAGDDLWLSPSHGRDTVAFHFTWVPDLDVVAPALASVEDALVPLGARPHWGKITLMDPAAVRERYPRSGDFSELLARYDPVGTFGNGVLDGYFPRR